VTRVQSVSISILMIVGVVLSGCGGGANSPFAPTRSPAAQPSATPAPQPLNLGGTWSGTYFVDGEISGNDGRMTLTLIQSGIALTGQFSIKDDLLLGDVAGTVTGDIVANGYTFRVSATSVSGFPGCSMQIEGRELGLGSTATPGSLQGSYKQALCGRTSNLENGVYQLYKQ